MGGGAWKTRKGGKLPSTPPKARLGSCPLTASILMMMMMFITIIDDYSLVQKAFPQKF